MLTINLQSDLPIAEQIRLGVRRAIAAGALKPGDPLPTVRQLAADLGINLNTVARAYRDLEAAGLVATVRGRGTVVTATTETRREPEGRRLEHLVAGLRDVLANARLAGLARPDVEALIAGEVDRVWPRE